MYYFIIVASMAVIAAVNIIFPTINGGLYWWQSVLAVLVFTAGVILVDGLMAFVARWVFPTRWFERGSKLVRVHKWEKGFYNSVGIKKWKDKVPELGGFTSFHKNKISAPKDNQYVARYIMEANSGAFGHLLGMIFAFALVAIVPSRFLFISLPVAFVNCFINSLSVMILRYNLPKLETLYRLNEKKAAKTDAALSENTESCEN